MIGIGGRKGTGKGVLANYLITNYGFYSFGFADYLKELSMEVFHLTKEQCEDPSEKMKYLDKPIKLGSCDVNYIVEYVCKLPFYSKHHGDKFYRKMIKLTYPENIKELKNPRDVLQYVGTEVLRDCIDPDFHVRVTYHRIIKKGVDLDKVVIHDARFPNERAFLRNLNANLILILEMTDIIKSEVDSHRSETGLGEMNEYDLVLVNDKRKGLGWFERMLSLYNLEDL